MYYVASSMPGKISFVALFTLLTIYIITYNIEFDKFKAIPKVQNLSATLPLWSQTLDFEALQLSNETGNPSGCYLVPNYIHYIHLGGNRIDYIQMICILSAFKNQKPEKIFFHYDDKRSFTGKYWDVLEKTPGFLKIVEFHKVKPPVEVFGQPLSEQWQKWHGSDVLRIQIIMKYGGIFIDNDGYLINNINEFRKFEMTINWDEGQFMGSQLIIAHKDARFLKRWLDCYREYDPSQWYYNAGEKPTKEVLYKEPELIHRVKVLFGADNTFIHRIFQMQWNNWKNMYAIHLLARHQYLLKSLNDKAKFPVQFNELNIANYPITFRDMAYDVYDVANIKWPTGRFD